MTRVWLALLLIVLGIAAVKAMPPEQQIIYFGGQSAASNPAQPTGKILRVDGISHILRVDGTSKICRAGGC